MRAPALLTALLALAAAPAVAQNTATPSPATISVSLQSTLPSTILWTVHVAPVFANGAPGPVTMTSPAALITTPGGQLLQTNPVVLSVRVPSGGSASVAETVTVSPATVAAALRLGASSLVLQRTFGVRPTVATGTATIAISGSAGGPLAISRVALHFEDRQLRRVLAEGQSAIAIAEVGYTGSGVLNGLWEVARPPSTLGEPVFVPLAAAAMNVAGGGLAELASPPLPTGLAGSYLVRFRLRSPAVPFEGLVIQYAVTDVDVAVQPIDVLAPEPHGTLGPATRFQWQPAAGAVAYRLEFFRVDGDGDPAQPVSGQWVPAERREALLSALAQTHLDPGLAYRWRIVALSQDGRVVGRSAFYEIRTP